MARPLRRYPAGLRDQYRMSRSGTSESGRSGGIPRALEQRFGRPICAPGISGFKSLKKQTKSALEIDRSSLALARPFLYKDEVIPTAIVIET
jgi:hypothetical protein